MYDRYYSYICVLNYIKMSESKLYTEKYLEKMCRKALFVGELFGRNKSKKENGNDYSLPMGGNFWRSCYSFS